MIIMPAWQRVAEQLIVFGKMNEAEFQFFLTGSRYFGGWNEESDWDFYAQDRPATADFLECIGFEADVAPEYGGDLNVNVVFRHPAAQIDVQLVQNLDLKTETQHTLRTHFGLLMTMSKVHRRELWRGVGSQVARRVSLNQRLDQVTMELEETRKLSLT